MLGRESLLLGAVIDFIKAWAVSRLLVPTIAHQGRQAMHVPGGAEQAAGASAGAVFPPLLRSQIAGTVDSNFHAVDIARPGATPLEEARQVADSNLAKARAELEETQAALRSAGAHAGRLVAAAGTSAADLARAQREDEANIVAICIRMRERDAAGRQMVARSAAVLPPPSSSAARAAERQAEQLQAAVRCGDWPGAASEFPASTALLIGLVSAACGNRLSPVLLDSYRGAITNALKMVEAEVELRCRKEAAGQTAASAKNALEARLMQPSTPLERRVAELERELAEAKAHVRCVERQDGAMLRDEREKRHAAESKLRQLQERMAAYTAGVHAASSNSGDGDSVTLVAPRREKGNAHRHADVGGGGATTQRAAAKPTRIPAPRYR